MTIGEDRVRIKFNPSADTLVDQIKQKTAELIDLCSNIPDKGSGSHSARCAALAMTYYETAAMYAVKSATTEKP